MAMEIGRNFLEDPADPMSDLTEVGFSKTTFEAKDPVLAEHD